MKRGKTQFHRLTELDRRIRARAYPNCQTFANEWEVSQKTVQRDIDFLRDSLNAPITYDRAHKGYYYEDESWFLPALALNEGELIALLLAVGETGQYEGTPIAHRLQDLVGKLSALLPDKISVAPELLYSRFSFKGPPAKPVEPDTWKTVVRGLLGQRVLKFQYRAFEARQDRAWTLWPLHLANLQGEWYLFGICEEGGDALQFALPRMNAVQLLSDRFPWPEDFDPERLLAGAFSRFAAAGKEHAVQLLFDAAVAGWVTERFWHPGQKVKRRTDGRIEMSFKAKGLYEVQRWVLSWGSSVEVLAPRELQDAVRAEIRSMAAREKGRKRAR